MFHLTLRFNWPRSPLLRSSMPVPEMNAGLDAVPIQKMCSAGSVLYPDLGEILTSLLGIHF